MVTTEISYPFYYCSIDIGQVICDISVVWPGYFGCCETGFFQIRVSWIIFLGHVSQECSVSAQNAAAVSLCSAWPVGNKICVNLDRNLLSIALNGLMVQMRLLQNVYYHQVFMFCYYGYLAIFVKTHSYYYVVVVSMLIIS